MTAFNVVRFRVRQGREKEFLDAHRDFKRDFRGFRKGAVIKTGERRYCFVGEWDDMASIVASRDQMIGLLDSFRGTLEELGGDLGVTDPVSGDVVLDVKPAGT